LSKKEKTNFEGKQYITIKISRSRHILKTSHFKIVDMTLGTGEKKGRYKIFKIQFEACTYGSPQHVLIHKLAEKGFDYAFIINNMEDIQNPMEEEIPMIYLKNGKPKYHYNADASTKQGVSKAKHSLEFICTKISAFFIIQGEIDFDGDLHAARDKNLLSPQLEIQQIGFDKI
jgi:hypothetical protein